MTTLTAVIVSNEPSSGGRQLLLLVLAADTAAAFAEPAVTNSAATDTAAVCSGLLLVLPLDNMSATFHAIAMWECETCNSCGGIAVLTHFCQDGQNIAAAGFYQHGCSNISHSVIP